MTRTAIVLIFLVCEFKAGQNEQSETRINRRWRDQCAISDKHCGVDAGRWRNVKEKRRGRVGVQTASTKQPSAREWILSIICMFKLGALKPTKRYLHSLYSHLQRQFRNDKSVCCERSMPPVHCQKVLLGPSHH